MRVVLFCLLFSIGNLFSQTDSATFSYTIHIEGDKNVNWLQINLKKLSTEEIFFLHAYPKNDSTLFVSSKLPIGNYEVTIPQQLNNVKSYRLSFYAPPLSELENHFLLHQKNVSLQFLHISTWHNVRSCIGSGREKRHYRTIRPYNMESGYENQISQEGITEGFY